MRLYDHSILAQRRTGSDTGLFSRETCLKNNKRAGALPIPLEAAWPRRHIGLIAPPVNSARGKLSRSRPSLATGKVWQPETPNRKARWAGYS